MFENGVHFLISNNNSKHYHLLLNFCRNDIKVSAYYRIDNLTLPPLGSCHKFMYVCLL